jgi:hypothetical protein
VERMMAVSSMKAKSYGFKEPVWLCCCLFGGRAEPIFAALPAPAAIRIICSDRPKYYGKHSLLRWLNDAENKVGTAIARGGSSLANKKMK